MFDETNLLNKKRARARQLSSSDVDRQMPSLHGLSLAIFSLSGHFDFSARGFRPGMATSRGDTLCSRSTSRPPPLPRDVRPAFLKNCRSKSPHRAALGSGFSDISIGGGFCGGRGLLASCLHRPSVSRQRVDVSQTPSAASEGGRYLKLLQKYRLVSVLPRDFIRFAFLSPKGRWKASLRGRPRAPGAPPACFLR